MQENLLLSLEGSRYRVDSPTNCLDPIYRACRGKSQTFVELELDQGWYHRIDARLRRSDKVDYLNWMG